MSKSFLSIRADDRPGSPTIDAPQASVERQLLTRLAGALPAGARRTSMQCVALSELESEVQERIRAFFSYRRRCNSNYLVDHPWVGKKIWRPVDVTVWGGQLVKEPWDDLLIADAKTHSIPSLPVKILRAGQRRSDGEWIAKDANSLGNRICRCFEPIPLDWTYFEIQKVHFLETSLIARPVIGPMTELLSMF